MSPVVAAGSAIRTSPHLAKVRLTDGVVDALARRLTEVAPERGGVLLGTGHLTTLFISDDHGVYSPSAWHISAEANLALAAAEAQGHGTYGGSAHSHPHTVPDPSPQDMRATERALLCNPHVHQLLVAIVTRGEPRLHDLVLTAADGGVARLSMHVMRRGPDSQLMWQRATVEIVALIQDLRHAGVSLASSASTHDYVPSKNRRAATRGNAPLPTTTQVLGASRLAIPVWAPEGDQTRDTPAGLLLVHPEYPSVGPMVVRIASEEGASGKGARRRKGQGTSLSLIPRPSGWDPFSSSRTQVAALVRRLTKPRIGDATARVWPLVGSLVKKRVAVVGCGSVGSTIADQLVRAGVGIITLLDGETVSPENLARSVYTANDIGVSKVTALACHLTAIDPALEVIEVQKVISDLTNDELEHILQNVDLVILATDDMPQQTFLAYQCYQHKVPHVACALYRKAEAGEVVVVLPTSGTACWSCAIGGGRAAGASRGERDYGHGGRLVGEAALGASINVVASYASILAIGMLAGPTSLPGEKVARLVTTGRTLGLVSTTPEWEFFPEAFGALPHQQAPQSVWPTIVRDGSCAICGSDPSLVGSGEHDQALLALIESMSSELAVTASADPRDERDVTPKSPGRINARGSVRKPPRATSSGRYPATYAASAAPAKADGSVPVTRELAQPPSLTVETNSHMHGG